MRNFINKLKSQDWDLFIVSAYGKIIPQSILNLPKYGTLNVHPSLLPKYRGATPIHSAILAGERETGVSIILLDEKMDHGPVISQKEFNEEIESINYPKLSVKLAILSANLLIDTLPKFLAKEIKPIKQNLKFQLNNLIQVYSKPLTNLANYSKSLNLINQNRLYQKIRKTK